MIEVTTDLDTSIEALTLKIKYITLNFKPWKEKILVKVKEKLSTKLRQKIKPKQPKPVLSNPDVKKYREELHPKFLLSLIKHPTNLRLYVENTMHFQTNCRSFVK